MDDGGGVVVVAEAAVEHLVKIPIFGRAKLLSLFLLHLLGLLYFQHRRQEQFQHLTRFLIFDPKTLVKIVTRIYAFHTPNKLDARPSLISQGNDFLFIDFLLKFV
jgi:hypothetical protein